MVNQKTVNGAKEIQTSNTRSVTNIVQATSGTSSDSQAIKNNPNETTGILMHYYK